MIASYRQQTILIIIISHLLRYRLGAEHMPYTSNDLIHWQIHPQTSNIERTLIVRKLLVTQM